MTTVTVVCDSPRHARGKVTKLVTFTVDSDGVKAALTRRIKRDVRLNNRITQAAAEVYDGTPAGQERIEQVTANIREGRKAHGCNLCGAQVPPPGEELHRVVREAAAAGENSISLADLRSRIHDQEHFE